MPTTEEPRESWAVQRKTRDRRTTIIARGLTKSKADFLADYYNAGPNGPLIGSKQATYEAVPDKGSQ